MSIPEHFTPPVRSVGATIPDDWSQHSSVRGATFLNYPLYCVYASQTM